MAEMAEMSLILSIDFIFHLVVAFPCNVIVFLGCTKCREVRPSPYSLPITNKGLIQDNWKGCWPQHAASYCLIQADGSSFDLELLVDLFCE